MLRLVPPDPPDAPLDGAEQFALSTLVDFSRVLPVEGPDATGATHRDCVELHLTDAGHDLTLSTARANGWYVRPLDGRVELPRQLLQLVTSIAGAASEQHSSAADRFGRVPHSENALVSERTDAGVSHAERDPVVNRIAIALRKAVIDAAGRRPVVLCAPWPSGKRWAVAMSHDVDVVSAWPAFTALRVAELLRKRDVRRVTQVVTSAAGSALRNPVLAAARHVMDVERRNGIRSTWFIITETPSLASIRAGDVTYTPESAASRRIIDAISEAGHELGLHGSFATMTEPGLFLEQRDRLAALVRRPVAGVRQHFLRMRPGATHREMARAGFSYDSTFGFSDRNGFRLGAADVLPVWDEQAGQPLELEEVPFLWMDRSLSKYQGEEDPGAWIGDALAIARVCQEVEGVWTGIWHPNLSPALGFPGAPEGFASLCESLMRESPWSASMGEIVRWRRGRRGARALHGAAGGALRVRVPEGASSLRLEDASGMPVPFTRA